MIPRSSSARISGRASVTIDESASASPIARPSSPVRMARMMPSATSPVDESSQTRHRSHRPWRTRPGSDPHPSPTAEPCGNPAQDRSEADTSPVPAALESRHRRLHAQEPEGRRRGLGDEVRALPRSREPVRPRAARARELGRQLLRLAPGERAPFGHKHKQQEEVYVVVGGSGRIKLDDEVLELRRWDAIRIPTDTMRNLEGGPDGIELILFGAPNAGFGDAELAEGWWAE